MSSAATSATSGGAYGKTIPPSKNASSLARPRDEANLLDEADMWATVCDILHTSPVEPQLRDDLDVYTSHSVSSYQDPCLPKPKRIRVYTNKAEVQQLEAEIRDLQAQLMAAKQSAMSSSSNKVSSMWARVAARQRLDKNKCLDENQQLQAAVAERSEHIQRLQKLILKTPRWTSLPEVTDESACLGRQLPADPALRLAAIHRLADRHLQRFHTAFIQAGALDLTHDMCRGDSIALAQDQIGFQSINHINLPAPYRSIADACWRVLSGRLSTEEEIHTPLEHQDVKADPSDVIAALKQLVLTNSNEVTSPRDDPPSLFLVPFLERKRRMRPQLRSVIEQVILQHNAAASVSQT
ncbi:hypothetical protein DYB31_002843 [Aphanomyces astaci]|uniref:Uncharacterized protein n=2 Tax=Aphanomyces astaci TaxID=112090 RepID=A0A397FW70_APHAT|nr:hypothetical protein DYB31_002843 [Aphanomyces astaci]